MERNQELVCFCWLNCWMMRLMFALQANEKKHVATADEWLGFCIVLNWLVSAGTRSDEIRKFLSG